MYQTHQCLYFLITDHIEEKDLKVQYCFTEMMSVNILNKPKQGAPFSKDHAMLMNCLIKYDDAFE